MKNIVLSKASGTFTEQREARKTRSPFVQTMLLAMLLFLATCSGAWAQTAVAPSGAGTSGDPYLITSLGNLVWMQEQAAASATSGKYYTLQNDIDASVTAGGSYNSGAGFSPIGTVADPTRFKGIFDGGGYTISNSPLASLTSK